LVGIKVSEKSIEKSIEKSLNGSSPKVEEPVPKKSRSKISDPPDPRVTEVMKALQQRRGYAPPRYGAEAKEVKNMLKAKYTPEQILGCYNWLKSQPFWVSKPLRAYQIANHIGEFVNGAPARASPNGRATRVDQNFADPERYNH
jgi:hypothetical protein